ncbi:Metallo-dependent hydrolase [Auricularia subglabra TFB-10046 SS5]|nr:Metallo-dependent hydrolase [Auricularia subglabra TFB-10046 SS5]
MNTGANILLQGGTVIAYDSASERLQVLRNTSVHIVDDRIVGLYGPSAAMSLPQGADVVDVHGHVVSPGFVDTHRHGWQTAFKTLCADVSLMEYFQRFSGGGNAKAQYEWTAEDVYIGTLAGNYEALNAGVTSIVDHARHTWSKETSAAGLDASLDSGLRIFWAYAVQSLTNGFTIQDQLEDLRSLYDAGKWKGTPTTLAVGFDEAIDQPPETVSAVLQAAKDVHASAFTSHYSGGPWGGECLPQVMHKYGFLETDIPVIFAHGSWMSATDMSLLRRTNQFISITPESEMHYGHDHPFSHLFLDHASLGVDTHCSFSTDIVGQARLFLQTTRQRVYGKSLRDYKVQTNTPMTVEQAFLLATRNGGRALRRDDIGVIRVGAKADIVVFDGTSPNMLGWRDPVAAVLLHSNVADVKHVLVDGKLLKRDGKIVHGDWEAVRQRFITSCDRIQELWARMAFADVQGKVRGASEMVGGQTVNVNTDFSAL